ncbi:hypothetical protein DNTS_008743, partial [Danionella cerebrum]
IPACTALFSVVSPGDDRHSHLSGVLSALRGGKYRKALFTLTGRQQKRYILHPRDIPKTQPVFQVLFMIPLILSLSRACVDVRQPIRRCHESHTFEYSLCAL